MKDLTVLLTASGSPGTAALVRALRENGERRVRVVGTDMAELAVGRHLCDAFHVVPPGDDPGFADAVAEVAEREGVDAVLPQSSYDLPGLAAARDALPVRGARRLARGGAPLERQGGDVRAARRDRRAGAGLATGAAAARRSRRPRASSATRARRSR